MNERLENESIPKLLISLAIPSILAMLVTLLYNMIDRIYIGHMDNGSLAIAGVGLCGSIITIITAFTNLFGRGGSPLASIALGSKEDDKANAIISNCFTALICSGVVMMIVLGLFGRNILYLFGASDNTIGYAMQYLSVYMWGTIFVQLSVGMNYFINCQGQARFGMMTLLIGSILNIILDPIFIFVLDMGVSGAALATIISQFVSCAWVMKFLFSSRSVLKIKKELLKPNWSIMKKVLGLGISPFFMGSTEGLLQVCFNRQLLFYGGDLAVSSMTILFSISQIVFLPMEGIAQGSQPIISYNYGAKQFDRVKKTIRLCLGISLTFSLVMVTLMECMPQVFVGLFANEPELCEMASYLLRIYMFGFAIMGANSTFQQSYTSLGEGKRSFFFAFYRKIILLIPLIYILPVLTGRGVEAVVLAEPFSDIITALTNAVFFTRFIKQKF